jgi:hypothetical protein
MVGDLLESAAGHWLGVERHGMERRRLERLGLE